MTQAQDLPPEALARGLTYAGFVLVGYELVKDMIVGPIKLFYKDTTFGQGMPFKTYDEDVRTRHKNEFEACLLYLRDFMEAVDDADFNGLSTDSGAYGSVIPSADFPEKLTVRSEA